MDFSLIVLRVRNALGLTMSEFKSLTGLSVSTISSVELKTRSLSEIKKQKLLSVLRLSQNDAEIISFIEIENFIKHDGRLVHQTESSLVKLIAMQCYARMNLGIKM